MTIDTLQAGPMGPIPHAPVSVRLVGKPVFFCCCHAQLLMRVSSGRFCCLFTESDGQLRGLIASLWVGAHRIDSLGCEHPWITLTLKKVGRCLLWHDSLRSGNRCSGSKTEQEKDGAQNIPFGRIWQRFPKQERVLEFESDSLVNYYEERGLS